MNLELVSYIIGGSFGIFLTLQYILFFFLIMKKNEIKKSNEDSIYIILIGFSIILSGLSGAFSVTLEGRLYIVIFNKLKLIFGIFIINFYVMLLRYIMIKIKDMSFVETDGYKQNSRKYQIVFIILSIVLAGFIISIDFSYRELSLTHSLFLISLLVIILIAGIIEFFAFRNILKKESGKITPINFFRYCTILGSGIAAIIFIVFEIAVRINGWLSFLEHYGSFYMYGITILSIGLSLNFVFEYMDVLTRANEANKKLSDLNRQMMYDVRTAQSLQISLLPLDKQKIIQNFIDMEISYMPMQSVGGDYYDFYKLDDKNILLLLGDASGHGVYAAMIWAILKVEVEELIEDNMFHDLSQAFNLLNNRISRILENTYSYATLFACLINLETREVSYISAGHTDQLYFYSGGQAINRIRNKNPIIGIFRTAKYSAESITCQKGDVLLLFSDGIIEGTNPAGELLGKERLEDLFLEACLKSDTASNIIGDVLLKTEDFFEGAIQKDDRTIMVIKL